MRIRDNAAQHCPRNMNFGRRSLLIILQEGGKVQKQLQTDAWNAIIIQECKLFRKRTVKINFSTSNRKSRVKNKRRKDKDTDENK